MNCDWFILSYEKVLWINNWIAEHRRRTHGYSKPIMRIQQLEKAERHTHMKTFYYFKLAVSRNREKVESQRFRLKDSQTLARKIHGRLYFKASLVSPGRLRA